MNFVGDGELMHNHESGWKEEALENCGGAVRRNIIPKSLTLPYFTPKNVTFLTLFYFRLKLGINSLHHFQTKRGIAIQLIAELSRAKRASGAPWVRKFGKLSIRENLVIT